MKTKISVIVLNYNGERFIEKCLTSLCQQTYQDFEIIVVDNASLDASRSIIKGKFPQVNLIESDVNLGFSVGNNLGAKNAKGEYIFFLNNDTYLEKTTLESVIKSYEKIPGLGILGCKILNLDGTVQESGVSIDHLGFPIKAKSKDIFYVSGCALFIKKALFKKVGGFDRDFFMFVEDVDLAWKIHLLGLKVLVDQKALVYHYGGATIVGGTIKAAEYVTTYKRIFFREAHTLGMLIRNYELKYVLAYIPLYLFVNILEALVFFVFLKPKVSLQYFRAWWWNVVNLKTTLGKRKSAQSMRLVRDKEINKYFYPRIAKLEQLRKIGIPKFK